MKNNFYFRVRFAGEYKSKLPLCPNRKFKQSFWYAAIPISEPNPEGGVFYKFSTTYKDDIEKLEGKHEIALKNYENAIDRKFSS